MANSSKYVQLNQFVLLEYIYTDTVSPDSINTSAAPFFTIENPFTNQLHVLNKDNAIDKTGNVNDRSSIQVNDSEMVSTDIDLPLSYLEYDQNLVTTDIVFSPNINVVYDTVKLHFISGYNFDNNIDGYILKIETATSGLNPIKVVFANQTITKSDVNYELNPNPIRISNQMYDRYILLKIPSMQWINDQFYINPSNTNTFGYKSSPNNKGYSLNAPLYITFYQIDSTRISNRFRYFKFSNQKQVTISIADEFADLAAVITESSNGDYFEYYATWQNQLIEDYIFYLNNKSGGNWIIIHDIILTEQIATEFKKTDNLNSIQNSEYDKPRIYRPVVQNSEISFAFHIDYVMRLYNQTNGQQIIKNASLTSYEPKKYGKELSKISLGTDPEVHKIYNQITDSLVIQTPPIKLTPVVNTLYVPTFFNNNNINLTTQTVSIDENGKVVSEVTDSTQTVYGQGKLELVLNPFDNLYKFKVFTKDKDVLHSFDLHSSQDLELVFIIGSSSKDNGQKIFISELKDTGTSNKQEGEIVFNISPENVDKITKSKNNTWYLINKSTGGFQRPIFRGTWSTVEAENEEGQLRQQINSLKSLLEDEKKKHTEETDVLKNSFDKISSELSQTKNNIITELLSIKNVTQVTPVSTQTSDSATTVSETSSIAPPSDNKTTDNSQLVNPVGTNSDKILNTAKSDPGIKNAKTLKNLVVPKFFRKGILKILNK